MTPYGSTTITELEPRMLDWDECVTAGPRICGGKGYNLARLIRYGFRIPDGGVLSAFAYRHLMQDPGLRESIQQGKSVRLPPASRTAIQHFINKHGLQDVPLAIRSSATMEDSAQASFAGVHASFLNVSGLNAIEEAVVACYRSLWSPHARAYRTKLGFSDHDVDCAVVICRMVVRKDSAEPRCAGVSFTADPATGRRDTIVIEAGGGLGTSVVGGKVTPQRFTLRTSSGRLIQTAQMPEHSLLEPAELGL
jgi:rifampicin phosphotransferase